MQQLASDLNSAPAPIKPEQAKLAKSERESFLNVAIADWDHRDCRAGDNMQQDILRWLSPPDPWKNYHIACKSRHPGSAAWFIQGNSFSEWKASETPSFLLWLHGKRPSMRSS
jgi:hypothetical protein